MYEGNKLHRVTLRLNPDQFGYVKASADILGVSPSEFLRMVINSTMAITTQATAKIQDLTETIKGGQGRENDKADINDSV